MLAMFLIREKSDSDFLHTYISIDSIPALKHAQRDSAVADLYDRYHLLVWPSGHLQA